MNTMIAHQIMVLINKQNHLIKKYSIHDILDSADEYLTILDSDDVLIGVVKIKKLNWFMCELSHLSVSPFYIRQGFAQQLLDLAEKKAKKLKSTCICCSIRYDNISSINLFLKKKYLYVSEFIYKETRRVLYVLMKTIV